MGWCISAEAGMLQSHIRTVKKQNYTASLLFFPPVDLLIHTVVPLFTLTLWK